MRDISVVVTCFNQAAFIGSAIESVLAQTALERICEIIVVDDGSTDGSDAIIEHYGSKFALVTPLHQANAGAAAARNTGLAAAGAPLVAFLDGDDIWLPEKLLIMVGFADRMPEVGLFFSDYLEFQDSDEPGRRVRVRHYNRTDSDSLERLFVSGGPILPSAAIARHSVFKTCGEFDTSLRTNEDPDMWLRIAARYPIQRIPRALVRKRTVQGSLGSFAEEKAMFHHRITEKAIAACPRLAPYRSKREARIAAYLASAYLARSRRWEALKVLALHMSDKGPRGKLLAYVAVALCPLPCRHTLHFMQRLRRQIGDGGDVPRPA